jgi:hypothetical protein
MDSPLNVWYPNQLVCNAQLKALKQITNQIDDKLPNAMSNPTSNVTKVNWYRQQLEPIENLSFTFNLSLLKIININ